VATLTDEKLPILPPRWKHTAGHVVLTLDEAMCARLRELPDWSSRSEDFVAEDFMTQKGAKWARTIPEIAAGTELRVIIDQFSRQAFLIDGALIVHIDSF